MSLLAEDQVRDMTDQEIYKAIFGNRHPSQPCSISDALDLDALVLITSQEWRDKSLIDWAWNAIDCALEAE